MRGQRNGAVQLQFRGGSSHVNPFSNCLSTIMDPHLNVFNTGNKATTNYLTCPPPPLIPKFIPSCEFTRILSQVYIPHPHAPVRTVIQHLPLKFVSDGSS